MIEGGCRCGAVRYTIARNDLLKTYACHCHICQRWSGSAFSQQALTAEVDLNVTGPVAIYEHVTDDRTSIQRVCAICHSRIYNVNTRRPGLAVLRAGTLDRSEELVCVAHLHGLSPALGCDPRGCRELAGSGAPRPIRRADDSDRVTINRNGRRAHRPSPRRPAAAA